MSIIPIEPVYHPYGIITRTLYIILWVLAQVSKEAIHHLRQSHPLQARDSRLKMQDLVRVLGVGCREYGLASMFQGRLPVVEQS